MKLRLRALYAAMTATSLTMMMSGCLEQGVVLNKPPAGIANTGRFTGNPARLSRIELRVSQFTQLQQGQSAQLEVVAFDDQGNQIDPALLNLKWTAENGAALNVDAQGRVTGLQPVAISNVTVTDINTNVSDTGQVAVTGPFTGDPAALDRLFFAFANQSLLNQGDSVPFVLIAVDNQGRPIDPAKLGQINWAVSDTSRFAIDAKGVVTALTDGQSATPAQVTATHAASGKIAAGSVDMLRGGGASGGPSPIPSAPAGTPAPGASPSAQPSATSTPSAMPSPGPTPTPSATATPMPTPVPSGLLTGNPAMLAVLSISPSTRTIDDEGDTASFFVQAVDSNGNYIDPAQLNFSWSTDKPTYFRVVGNGRDAVVTALRGSGFADIIVTETGSGKTAVAKINMGSGGGGGGGGGTRPSATPTPQYQVNTTEDANQIDPDVAIDANGDYVVVWTGYAEYGSSFEPNIYFQRYNNEGEPQGDETQVNFFTAGNQTNPSVAMDENGNFVVVFNQSGGGSYGNDVFARYFDANGAATEFEFRVNLSTASDQYNQDVAMDDDGDFAVVWQSSYTDGNGIGERDTYGLSIVGRLFNRFGDATSSELYINTITIGNQSSPKIASDGTGEYVVVWEGSSPEDNDSGGIRARRFDDSDPFFVQGSSFTYSEFQINDVSTSIQLNPSIAMESNGDFVVAWSSTQDFSGEDIIARRFDADDQPLANSFQVNLDNDTLVRLNPDVGTDEDGDFVVTWDVNTLESSGSREIHARLFDNGGSGDDEEIVVNDPTTSNQTRPAVALDDDGDFVIVWQALYGDVSGYSIEAKNFTADGEAR